MRPCLIGLGSNQGDSAAIFRDAARRLAAAPRISIRAASSLYASVPAGGPPSQREFLNAALLLETDVPAEELLNLLLDIESQLGRERTIPWGPRTLDLDLLLAGDEVMSTPRLTLPHPRMMVRRFAVVPAAEIAPEMKVPSLHWLKGNLASLRDHLLTSAKRVWLVAKSPTGESWQEALASQLPQWEFLTVADFHPSPNAVPPRFVALACSSLSQESLASVRLLHPWVLVTSESVEAATAEVVAHCIASDTILEKRAGSEWMSS